MVRHPAAGTEPGLAQRDHSLTLAEVVKSLFYNTFIDFTYMGCEGDGTVVTDLLPGFSPLRNGSDGGVFTPVWNHPAFPAALAGKRGKGERKKRERVTDRQTDRQRQRDRDKRRRGKGGGRKEGEEG